MTYNSELIIRKLQTQLNGVNADISAIQYVLDKMDPVLTLYKFELEAELDRKQSEARSIVNQLFDIRKHMA